MIRDAPLGWGYRSGGARLRWSLVAIALAMLALSACGDEAGDPTPPTARATSTPSPTPSPTATPAPSGDPAVPEALAQGAGYFLYEARANATVEELAAAFGAEGLSADDLRTLNQLGDGPLAEGQVIAVPNTYADGELVPVEALEAILEVDLDTPGLRLLRPSADLIDGLLGRVALHRVRLAGPDDPGGAGYVIAFVRTDRPAVKGGVVDPDARVAGAAFVVAGGSLASELEGDAVHRFERDGIPYAILAEDRSGPSAQRLADLLDDGGG